MKIEKKDFYSLQELADTIGVGRRTVYNWKKDGKIKATKMGKEYRITAAEFNRILKEGL